MSEAQTNPQGEVEQPKLNMFDVMFGSERPLIQNKQSSLTIRERSTKSPKLKPLMRKKWRKLSNPKK